MSPLDLLYTRPRLTLSVAFMLSLLGLAAWFLMPREEDPRLAERAGLLVVPYPGADVLDVERLVASPIEDELAEVAEMDSVVATLRTGLAVFNLQLRGDVAKDATDAAWDEVEDALDAAAATFPEGVLPYDLQHNLIETQSILFAVTGPSDRLTLADAADALEARLLTLDDVSRVVVSGDPGEQVTVDFDDGVARRLGIDPLSLADQLERSNVSLAGGSIALGGQRLTLRPATDFESVEEIAALPIAVGGNGPGAPAAASVPLGSVARVARTVATPAQTLARHEGRPAVMLGVIPRPGLQAERFGEHVAAEAAAFADERPELAIATVAFQPDRVKARLGDLGASLLLGVGIVAAVVFLFMGLRMGLVVSSVVPLVTFASVAVYAGTGGVLQQIAVAALVIALGLLVDNAIVVAETIQRRLDEGATPEDAARDTVTELAVPLGAATATTLASFVPMYLSVGTSGDFTRAIPVVVMLTLTVSYGYALLVTPALARFGLRAAPRQQESRFDRVAGALGRFAARRPLPTLGIALGLVLACGAFAPHVKVNFFPTSDRDQVLVEVELPEGTHLATTDEAARRVEAYLAAREDVDSVTAWVGRSAPNFYYNLPRRPQAPFLAQLLVDARSRNDVNIIRQEVEAMALEELPGAQVIARRLEQGPPVRAPIEVRLYHDDLGTLRLASDAVRGELRSIEGARSVRADYGPGVPTLRYGVDDASANRHGVDRQRIALALLGRSRGLPAGRYRAGDDPAPIVLRSGLVAGGPHGEALGPDEILAGDVARPGNAPLPLAQVARSSLEWRPAVVHHRDGRRVANVLSEHADEVTYQSVLKELTPELPELLAGVAGGSVRHEVGGAAAESKKANGAIGAKGPIGALLLVTILLAVFNSFRRTFIVLMTAPLAFLGVWPGLFALSLPFGFVALLGAIALIGIAVNGAIVLIDFTELRRKEGASVEDALALAVKVRTRPILLTTATTIAGLFPLLLSESTLWPPLAAAMISGLFVSTLLTLGVIPALYRLLFREATPEGPPAAAMATALLALGMLLAPGAASAQAPTPAPSSGSVEVPDFDLEAVLRGDVPGGEAGEDARATRLTGELAASLLIARSPAMDQVAAGVARADAAVREARVALFPRLDLSARYTRLSNIDNDPIIDLGSQAAGAVPLVEDPAVRGILEGLLLTDSSIEVFRNQYALRATASYPVSDLFLQILPGYRATQDVRAAAEAQATVTEAELRMQAKETFYGHVRARSLFAVAAHRRLLAADRLRRARAAFAAGQVPAVDVRVAEALDASAAIGVSSARAGVDASAEALRALLELPEGPLQVAEDVNAALPPPPAPLPVLVERARAARPEVLALRAAVAANAGQADAARGSRYPSLVLAAGVDYANPNTLYVPQRERFDASWDVSAILRWSPNDLATGGARLAGAEARLATAEADLRALDQAIRVEVADAYARYEAAREARELARAGVLAAEAAFEARERAWEVGSGAIGDVFDADVELTSARVQQIDAAIEARIAQARLDRATGAGAVAER
ncbi:MAG: efflux RND transporter permease subunit [Myxococcota bacterium]